TARQPPGRRRWAGRPCRNPGQGRPPWLSPRSLPKWQAATWTLSQAADPEAQHGRGLFSFFLARANLAAKLLVGQQACRQRAGGRAVIAPDQAGGVGDRLRVERAGAVGARGEPPRRTDPMKLQPLGDRVVVEREEAQEKTAGGIVLPDTAKDKPQKGKVVAVGEGRLAKDGKRRDLQGKVVDNVLSTSYAGGEVKLEGDKKVLLMREDDILAVID